MQEQFFENNCSEDAIDLKHDFKKYGNYQLKKSDKSLPENDGFSKQKFPRNLSEGYLLSNFTRWKLISAQNLLFIPLLILKLR